MQVDLHYKKFGTGPETLIILHGLFGSLDNWQSLAKEFGDFYTTYVIDQRNHGKSPHTNTHDYSGMAADLLHFMDVHQIESANILGHSMGGKTVMQFAIENPHKADKLIVADIAPKYYPPHHQTILAALNSVDFNQTKTRQDVENKITETIQDPGIVQFLMKGLTWVEKEQLGWKFNLKVLTDQIENIGEKLSGFAYYTNPTLFLRGENSNYIKDEDFEDIEEIFPLVSIVDVPDSGHWLHAENPLFFKEKVLEFLKK